MQYGTKRTQKSNEIYNRKEEVFQPEAVKYPEFNGIVGLAPRFSSSNGSPTSTTEVQFEFSNLFSFFLFLSCCDRAVRMEEIYKREVGKRRVTKGIAGNKNGATSSEMNSRRISPIFARICWSQKFPPNRLKRIRFSSLPLIRSENFGKIQFHFLF